MDSWRRFWTGTNRTPPFGGCRRLCWDREGFTSWPQVKEPVRVVRSLETRTVRRQLDGQLEALQSDWLWATTLAKTKAPPRAAVQWGHARWTIENEGFNEMVTRWHADHVYRHEPTAMLVLWLPAMACLNLFWAFYRRNLKPAARRSVSMLHVSRLIAAELYSSIPAGRAWAPT